MKKATENYMKMLEIVSIPSLFLQIAYLNIVSLKGFFEVPLSYNSSYVTFIKMIDIFSPQGKGLD